ncbi:hypothetical protein Aduo_003023 [Ancylostoma duodenale]
MAPPRIMPWVFQGPAPSARNGMTMYEIVILAWLVVLVLAQRGGDILAVGPYSAGRRGQRVGGVSMARAVDGGGGPAQGGEGNDFNPILLQGVQGDPGIRIRLGQKAFQYANGMIAEVLNQEIVKFRIPPIVQCLPQVNGCVQIYNLYISRYRRPQQIVIYPAPPNRIALQVQNVDVGITGNLGGQVVILLLMPFAGFIQVNIHQATITVELSIERGRNAPYLRVLTCKAQTGYADAYVENGGTIGDFINSVLRQRISNIVRRIIPRQLCGQLPSIINEKVNSRLADLPQAIAAKEILNMFMEALIGGAGGSTPTSEYCQTHCHGNQPINQTKPSLAPTAEPALTVVHQRNVPAGPSQTSQFSRATNNGRPFIGQAPPHRVYQTNQATVLQTVNTVDRKVPHAASPLRHRAIPYRSGNEEKMIQMFVPVRRAKRQNIRINPQGPRLPPPPPAPGAPPPTDLCAKCPVSGDQSDSLSLLRQFFSSLNMSKLNDLKLSLQLLNIQATSNDFTIDLTGEFSPNAQGGTPFGPFPTTFPSYRDDRMANIMLSDYTINSLLYWMYRKQFFSVQLGPETPQIGALLKTTCADNEDFAATKVKVHMRALRTLKKTLRTKRAASIGGRGTKGKREDLGDLGDIGCLGEFLPGVKEEYPKQNLSIQIRAIRAPSVIFSATQGGMVTLDALLDADIYIDEIKKKLGTFTIAITVVVTAQLRENRLTGSAQITNFNFTDRTGSLKMKQDSLDNLANLLKSILFQPFLNNALQKGITINIPTNGLFGLPINLIHPEIRIIEHGLYIATDLTISLSLLGMGGAIVKI